MSYLDYEKLETIDPAQFQEAKPYPWLNPGGLLTEAGYQRLLANLPDISMFQPMFRSEARNHRPGAVPGSQTLSMAQPRRAADGSRLPAPVSEPAGHLHVSTDVQIGSAKPSTRRSSRKPNLIHGSTPAGC